VSEMNEYDFLKSDEVRYRWYEYQLLFHQNEIQIWLERLNAVNADEDAINEVLNQHAYAIDKLQAAQDFYLQQLQLLDETQH